MKHFLFCLAILIVALCAFDVAQAQVKTPMSNDQLQKLCTSRYDIDVGICAGYITAIAEHIMQDNNPQQRVCLSPAIGPQILMDHVQKYWLKSPPKAQDLASIGVEQALRAQFRCP
jgi:hypothetical protein